MSREMMAFTAWPDGTPTTREERQAFGAGWDAAMERQKPSEEQAEALDAGDEKELPFVTVCVKGNQISVFGMPVSDEHNCDEMGCSSVEHAIVRGTITALDPGLRSALAAHEGKEKS